MRPALRYRGGSWLASHVATSDSQVSAREGVCAGARGARVLVLVLTVLCVVCAAVCCALCGCAERALSLTTFYM
eukprot:scaffold1124_cov131-Isochrysis_galbana.AAC.7